MISISGVAIVFLKLDSVFHFYAQLLILINEANDTAFYISASDISNSCSSWSLNNLYKYMLDTFH